jgi:hypothetical protein
MSRFAAGDFLVFQLEAGFALLRLLAAEGSDTVWHVAGYRDFFPDVDAAERAIGEGGNLTISEPHMALTNRAFESTQVATIANKPLEVSELSAYESWKIDPNREVSNRSVRLMLGLR